MVSNIQHYTAQAVLPAFAGLGVFGTGVLARNAGLMKSIIQSLKIDQPLLPGTTIPLIRTWTHITPIDKLLQFLITFFWPIVDGKNATINLQSRHFIGQLIAIWLLIEAEGAKAENRGTVASHVTIAGMGVQLLGAATAIPVWCARHLSTYSAVRNGNVTASPTSNSAMAIVPYATTLGLILPIMMMTVVRGSTAKQFWIVMFQVYPILIFAFSKILGGIPGLAKLISSSDAKQANANIVAMATTISAISHIVTFGPSLLSLLPNLFSQTRRAKLNPWIAFVPNLTTIPKGDMTQARLNFLKWDEVVTLGAFIVWAIVKNISASTSSTAETPLASLMAILPKVFIRSIILGPVGAVANLSKKD